MAHLPEPNLRETLPDIPGPPGVGALLLPNGLATGPPISQQLQECREPTSPVASNRDWNHFSTEATPQHTYPGVNDTADRGASSHASASLDPTLPHYQLGRNSDTEPAEILRLAFLGSAFEPGELSRNRLLSSSVRASGPGSKHNSPPPDMISGSDRTSVPRAGFSGFLNTSDTSGVGSWCPKARDINIVQSLTEENGFERDRGCQ